MTENVAGTEPLYRVVSRRRVDGVEARGVPLPRDAAQACADRENAKWGAYVEYWIEPVEPEPAVGQVWRQADHVVTILRVDPAAALVVFVGGAAESLACMRSEPAWRCVGVETPGGRVMVGERRRVVDHGHPSDGQPVRVHSVITDGFVALDFGGDDGLPRAYSAARVASWPLVGAPEPLTAETALRAKIAEAIGKLEAHGPTVGTRAWYVDAAVNLLHLVTPGGLTAADVDIGGETGYLDVLVPWRVTENYRASAEDVLREAAPVGPLVLRIVRVDPYTRGRIREEALLALDVDAEPEPPRPSARTLALRALVGEQTAREAYPTQVITTIDGQHVHLRHEAPRWMPDRCPQRRDPETVRVLAAVAEGRQAWSEQAEREAGRGGVVS